MKAMQTLALFYFRPLTTTQPYQREQDERRPPGARVDRGESAQATRSVNPQRVAVRSIAWLDDWRGFMLSVE